ncbi:MAG: KamA family radical SAM protein [Chloroflexi bacterium]|nr:KamA family radical SAM protein [Chloroflexota bacterium]
MKDELINAEIEEDTEEPPSKSDEEPPSRVAGNQLSCQLLDEKSPSWGDWRWQMKHRIRSIPELLTVFPHLNPLGICEAASRFPLAITPYYAALIRSADRSDPVFMMSVPQPQELYDSPYVSDDPLEEGEDMVVPGLVHRYPDRALFVVTSTCAMYCRHCTRKRAVGAVEGHIDSKVLTGATTYLRAHPEVTDVIISGGDPFTLGTAQLEEVIRALRSVPSIEIIRIGTRTPVTLPMRITPELVQMLRKYQPIWINTHFNHPNEITPDSIAACERLADAGFPLGNQSVLLKGVNDNPQTIEKLCRTLVKMRVRPYYLYQCDLVRGVEHFRTPLSRGIEIMEYLRGRLSGLAIPTFVVDAPHGGGKIPLMPSYIISMSPTHTVLRNFEGMLVGYPEPDTLVEEAVPADSQSTSAPSIWDLASGKATVIYPRTSSRLLRRKQNHQQEPERQ